MTTAFCVAFLLSFFRIAAFVAFMPIFSGRNVPHTVKVGLAVGLTTIWGIKVAPASALALSFESLDNWFLLGWLAIRETLFGASLGWLLGLILVPARIAGAYIVQEMGLTMATMTSATDSAESSVLSNLFEVLAILVILCLNLHHGFLRLFDATFAMFPLGQSWTLPPLEWLLGTITRTDQLGLALAAPVGIILFASMVLTLFVMRQTPQFNLFAFGMPLRLFVGLVAVFLFLPEIVVGMVGLFREFSRFGGL